MPVFTDALVGDTMHLSAEEFGAYLLLLIATWRNNGRALADDETKLARICRVSTRRWRERVRSVLVEFFDTNDGYWHQKRLEKEWQFVAKRAAISRFNGGKGGRHKQLENKESQNPAGIIQPAQNESTHTHKKETPLKGVKERVSPDASSPPAEARAAKRLVPEDWLPSPRGRQYAVSRAAWSDPRIEREVERFRSHHRKKGNRFASIDAAWETWVQNGEKFDAALSPSAVDEPQPDPQAEAALWRALLREFVETRAKTGRGYWPSNRGVPPGRSGCQVPPELLSEFGLSNAETVAA